MRRNSTFGARTWRFLEHTKMTWIKFQGTVRFTICIFRPKKKKRNGEMEERAIVSLESYNHKSWHESTYPANVWILPTPNDSCGWFSKCHQCHCLNRLRMPRNLELVRQAHGLDHVSHSLSNRDPAARRTHIWRNVCRPHDCHQYVFGD